MHPLFQPLAPADYAFLVNLLTEGFSLVNAPRLQRLLADVEADGAEAHREALAEQLELELRYLGSNDLAYTVRALTGQAAGVPLATVVRDAARALKVTLPALGTERELAEEVVHRYTTQAFGHLSREEQQALLEGLGVERERAAAFLKRSAGVFTLPALIQAFDVFVVQGLIKNVVFGTIARLLGRQLTQRLFGLVAGRFPWWLGWIGPAAWTLSIGWTVIDLQGPALRKTVPAMLYLGLCSLREGGVATAA